MIPKSPHGWPRASAECMELALSWPTLPQIWSNSPRVDHSTRRLGEQCWPSKRNFRRKCRTRKGEWDQVHSVALSRAPTSECTRAPLGPLIRREALGSDAHPAAARHSGRCTRTDRGADASTWRAARSPNLAIHNPGRRCAEKRCEGRSQLGLQHAAFLTGAWAAKSSVTSRAGLPHASGRCTGRTGTGRGSRAPWGLGPGRARAEGPRRRCGRAALRCAESDPEGAGNGHEAFAKGSRDGADDPQAVPIASHAAMSRGSTETSGALVAPASGAAAKGPRSLRRTERPRRRSAPQSGSARVRARSRTAATTTTPTAWMATADDRLPTTTKDEQRVTTDDRRRRTTGGDKLEALHEACLE